MTRLPSVGVDEHEHVLGERGEESLRMHRIRSAPGVEVG
jgi:hypothetical protein